jgi:hypothetical protein
MAMAPSTSTRIISDDKRRTNSMNEQKQWTSSMTRRGVVYLGRGFKSRDSPRPNVSIHHHHFSSLLQFLKYKGDR